MSGIMADFSEFARFYLDAFQFQHKDMNLTARAAAKGFASSLFFAKTGIKRRQAAVCTEKQKSGARTLVPAPFPQSH